MAQNKLKLNRKAIEELLLSQPVQSYVDRVGEGMAKAAGPGYIYKTEERAQRRSRGIVVTYTHRAKRDNIENLTLSRVLTTYRV